MKEALDAKIAYACKVLRLSGLARQYPAIAREAREQNQDAELFLLACLEEEISIRQVNKRNRLLQGAKFPAKKTLDSFRFEEVPGLSRQKVMKLADCEYIRHKENIVCIGKPGTGKTHISCSLGILAILEGFSVRFISTMALLQELQLSQKEYQLHKVLKKWDKIDLVICDELGYIPMGEEGKLLFQFISQRYERNSLILTTNLEFSQWNEVFNDPTLTSALLDRLTHHCHILVFDADSYRFKESMKKNH
jgi:DNA replication protein DnaC